MRSSLCSAVLVCAWRRARPVLGANPLLAAVAGAGTLAVPLAAWPAGRAAAPVLEAAAREPALAAALTVPLAVTSILVGLAVAALAPEREALGPQLAPAPVPRLDAVLALAGAPLGLLALAGAAVAFLFALPAAEGLPAGRAVAPALPLAGLAGAAAGAALAEAAIGAARGSGPAAALGVAVVAGWAWAGAELGSIVLGPLAVLPRAVAGRGLVGSHGVLAAAAGLGAAAWLSAAVLRPPPRGVRRVRSLVPLPRRPWPGALVAETKRLARHRSLRRHGAATVALAAGSAAVIRLALGVDGRALAAYAAVAAFLGAAVFPAAAAGLRKDAAWLLRAVPRPPWLVATAGAAAGALAGVGLVAAALIAVAPLGTLQTADYALLEGNLALLLGAAAASGALLPWRPDRVVEQVASYAALAATAAGLAWALGRLASTAAAAGLGETAFTVAAGNAVLVAGLLVAGMLER